jgi:ABC-type transporter Mla MlaB component
VAGTCRIDRSTTDASTVFVLSGEMNAEQVSELRALVESETTAQVVLDLADVTLVDRAAVAFLAGMEATGTKLLNCPQYVRTWIAGEVEKLLNVFPEQTPIDRTAINTWEDERCVRWAQKTGRKKLVMAALWTEICLAFPVIHALGDGYDVFFVTDASGGVSTEAHEMGIQRMIQAGAVPITSVEGQVGLGERRRGGRQPRRYARPVRRSFCGRARRKAGAPVHGSGGDSRCPVHRGLVCTDACGKCSGRGDRPDHRCPRGGRACGNTDRALEKSQSDRHRHRRPGVGGRPLRQHEGEGPTSSVRAMTNGIGVDLALDLVGGPMFELCLKSPRIGGRQVALTSMVNPRVEFDLTAFYHNLHRLIGVDAMKLSGPEIAKIMSDLRLGFHDGHFHVPTPRPWSPEHAVEAYTVVAKGDANKHIVAPRGLSRGPTRRATSARRRSMPVSKTRASGAVWLRQTGAGLPSASDSASAYPESSKPGAVARGPDSCSGAICSRLKATMDGVENPARKFVLCQ